MKEVINGISLRAIDWLVTNYSKGTPISIYNEEQKKRVDIHHSYEIQSNYYGRDLFDPFCRHERIYFKWRLQRAKNRQEEEDVTLVTTVGQLNFMKWANEYGVLVYAQNHREQIQTNMDAKLIEVNEEKKHYRILGKRRKRKELTKAPKIYCNVYSVNTVLHFDHESPLGRKLISSVPTTV
jgi:hypothetical protein